VQLNGVGDKLLKDRDWGENIKNIKINRGPSPIVAILFPLSEVS
jgi:hypothetical protein